MNVERFFQFMPLPKYPTFNLCEWQMFADGVCTPSAAKCQTVPNLNIFYCIAFLLIFQIHWHIFLWGDFVCSRPSPRERERQCAPSGLQATARSCNRCSRRHLFALPISLRVISLHCKRNPLHYKWNICIHILHIIIDEQKWRSPSYRRHCCRCCALWCALVFHASGRKPNYKSY